MNIEIVTGGSRELGFGHIKRSGVLAKYLSSHGYAVVLRDMTDSLSNPKKVLDLPYVACRILDLPPQLEANTEGILGSERLLVSLDGVKIQGDLNFSIFQHFDSTSIQNYTGYEYAIISDEFLKFRNLPYTPAKDYGSVCVCLGGGDILGQGPMIAEQLCSLGFNVSLVCGPYVTYTIDDVNLSFNVIREPSSVGEIFQKSDWIISNAGGTLFEALCMGKPVISCPQTTREEAVGQDLLGKGALMGLGIESALSPRFSRANEAIYMAKKTIDGLGKSRIKLMIEEALSVA